MSILIKYGMLVDARKTKNSVQDILIENCRVSRIADSISVDAQELIDAKGMLVMPGLVDMHAHLREPGREDKETIATATAAAVSGGVTSLLAMPNTNPCIDSPQAVGLLQKRIDKTALANVFIAGSITKNRKGHALVDFEGLLRKGVLAFTDDGASVDNEPLLLKAFESAAKINALIICHCEDTALSEQGAVNKGIVSTRMGLRGISKESEFQRIERDIKLAETARARIHIAHVSCAESVDIIRTAKGRGVHVTAETCPHYIMLSEEDVTDFDTNKKMNPPLRSPGDRDALKQAIKDGTIDILVTDHAPHTENEKDIEFERAAFGVIGLETLFAAAITALVKPGIIDIRKAAEICSSVPARILGIQKGTIENGADADIIIVDPAREWQVNKKDIRSKSKNSPFLGRVLTGKIIKTIIGGRLAHEA
jgi:dihydroorotase